MLLVLFREYAQRCGGVPRMDYRKWLDTITGYAEEMGVSFGDMVREEIDPTYKD
jgi:hypothetical protein